MQIAAYLGRALPALKNGTFIASAKASLRARTNAKILKLGVLRSVTRDMSLRDKLTHLADRRAFIKGHRKFLNASAAQRRIQVDAVAYKSSPNVGPIIASKTPLGT